MGVERDHAAHEMRALAEPGESRREHLMALFFQDVGDAPIAPAAGGRAVDQNEGLAVGLRQRGRHSIQGGPGRQPQHGVADHSPSRRRMLLVVHPALLDRGRGAFRRTLARSFIDRVLGHSSMAV